MADRPARYIISLLIALLVSLGQPGRARAPTPGARKLPWRPNNKRGVRQSSSPGHLSRPRRRRTAHVPSCSLAKRAESWAVRKGIGDGNKRGSSSATLGPCGRLGCMAVGTSHSLPPRSLYTTEKSRPLQPSFCSAFTYTSCARAPSSSLASASRAATMARPKSFFMRLTPNPPE